MTEYPDIGPGSEELKYRAEQAVHILGLAGSVGEAVFALAGIRVENDRLETEVTGLRFQSPVMVGAGWDKAGRCVDGLYTLGFAGTEIGTVTAKPQEGNAKPRLWTAGTSHGVSLNRLGFNNPGMEAVAANLARQRRPGVLGISLGINKDTPVGEAPAQHATVADALFEYGDYFVINVTSPNTPGLRGLMRPDLLRENIIAVQEALSRRGGKPLFVKTSIDLALADLDDVLEVCVDTGTDGIIDTNTTVEQALKMKYGWLGQPGGLAGNDPAYRSMATEHMKHITRQTQNTNLARIGVGGIHDAATAIERLEAGAQVVQVVTAIRQRRGLVARMINRGILKELNRRGVERVSDLIGVSA